MQENVYAAPVANLEIDKIGALPAAHTFYVVSPLKCFLLFVGTMGMYTLYWHFSNWAQFRTMARVTNSEGQDVWPLPRALFPIFFVYSLFCEVAAHAARNDRPLQWKPGANAAAIICLSVINALIDRLGAPLGNVISFLMFAVSLVVLGIGYCNAQQKINASCGDPQARSNDQLTWANWIWLVLGGIVWAVSIIDLLPHSRY